MKLLSIGAVLSVIIAILLLVLSAFCFVQSFREERLRVDEPAEYEYPLFKVQLDKTGEYEGFVEHPYTHTHGVLLVVKTEKAFDTADQAKLALTGLKARIRYPDDANTYRASWSELETFSSCPDRQGGFWPTFLFTWSDWPTEKGRHRIAFQVQTPAERLAGTMQQLAWHYHLCGVESLGFWVLRAVAVVLLVIGIPMALIARHLVKRWKRARQE